ncbi:MAG: hypothetical protein BalsKO_21010 [Balneolaceae bacterium]
MHTNRYTLNSFQLIFYSLSIEFLEKIKFERKVSFRLNSESNKTYIDRKSGCQMVDARRKFKCYMNLF